MVIRKIRDSRMAISVEVRDLPYVAFVVGDLKSCFNIVLG